MDRRAAFLGLATVLTGCSMPSIHKNYQTKCHPESTENIEIEGQDNSSKYQKLWAHEHHEDAGEAINYHQGKVFSGSKDNSILAACAEDGDLIWRKDLRDTTPRDLFAIDGTQYSALVNGEVIAVDVKDGSIDWTHEHHDDAVWEIHENDGIIYSAGRDAKVVAADSSDGSLLWSHEAHHVDGNHSNEMVRTVFHSDGVVYSAGFDGRIFAASADSGEILWEFEFGHSIKSVEEVDGKVYFAPWSQDVEYDVLVVDPSSSRTIDAHSHHNEQKSGHRGDHVGAEELHVSNEVVYSAGDGGDLVAAIIPDLTLLYKHREHEASVRSITSNNNITYTTARDGNVIAYGPSQ